jgi:hypothetical protein
MPETTINSKKPTFLRSLWTIYGAAVLVGQAPKIILETVFRQPKTVSQVSFILAGLILLLAARQTVVAFLSDERAVRRFGMLYRLWGFFVTSVVVIIGAYALTSGLASMFVILRQTIGFNPFAETYSHAQLLDYLLSSAVKAVLGDFGEIFGLTVSHGVVLDPKAATAMKLLLYGYGRLLGFGVTGTILLVGYLLLFRWWFAAFNRWWARRAGAA